MCRITFLAATLVVALSGTAAVADNVSNRDAISVLNTALSEFVDPSVQAGSPVISRHTANAIRKIIGIDPLPDGVGHRQDNVISHWTSYLHGQGFTDVNPESMRLDSSARIATVQWAMNRRMTAETELIPSDRSVAYGQSRRGRLSIAGMDNARDAFVRATGDDSISGISLSARDVHINAEHDVLMNDSQSFSDVGSEEREEIDSAAVADAIESMLIPSGDSDMSVNVTELLPRILELLDLSDAEGGIKKVSLVGEHDASESLFVVSGDNNFFASIVTVGGDFVDNRSYGGGSMIDLCRTHYTTSARDSIVASSGNDSSVAGVVVGIKRDQCRLLMHWTDEESLKHFLGDLQKNPIRVCGSDHILLADRIRTENLSDGSTVVGLVVESDPKACEVDIGVASDFNPMTMSREPLYTQHRCTRQYTDSDGKRVDSIVYCSHGDS